MNLNIKLPDEYAKSAPGKTLFCTPFDILDGKYVNGWLAVISGEIHIYAGGKELKIIPLSDFTGEFKVTPLYGSASFEGVTEKGDLQICRFTKKHIPRYMAVKSALNHYIKTGSAVNSAHGKEPFCTKCGRSIPAGQNVCYFCMDKAGIFRRLLTFATKYKLGMTLIVICTFAASGISLISPYLNRILVDNYLVIKNSDLFGILTVVALMLLTRLVLTLIGIASSQLNAKIGLGITTDLRNFAYQKVTSLSLSAFNHRSQGEIYSRIMSDTATINNFLTNNLVGIVTNFLTFIIAAFIIISTSPFLAFWVLIPIPVVYVCIFFFQKTMNRIYSRQWRQRNRSVSILTDVLRGIRVVKSIGNEKHEVERFKKETFKLADISMKNEQLFSTVYPFLNFVTRSGSYAVLFFGAVLVLGHKMTLGELSQFTGYVAMIYGPIGWYAYLPRLLMNTLTSGARFFEMVDEEQDVSDTENPVDKKIDGKIEFKDVTFGYNPFDPVIKDVNLEIRPGEMVGLVAKAAWEKARSQI